MVVEDRRHALSDAVHIERICGCLCSLQRQLAGYKAVGGGFFLVFQGSGDVNASCAADVELAFLLRVEVQQDVAFQCTFLEAESTVHAGFFIFRDEHFQRTVFQVFGFEYGHGCSNTQTVVGSQCRAFGFHPFAVYPCLDGVFGEVVNRIVILLRYHVHVGLQDDSAAVFHSWGGRLADDDVAYFVGK